jgi:hypothetical protein
MKEFDTGGERNMFQADLEMNEEEFKKQTQNLDQDKQFRLPELDDPNQQNQE